MRPLTGMRSVLFLATPGGRTHQNTHPSRSKLWVGSGGHAAGHMPVLIPIHLWDSEVDSLEQGLKTSSADHKGS